MQNKIRYWRERRGISQERLGELCHTSGAQISRLETGDRNLTVDWLYRIAKVLMIHPGNLLNMTEFDIELTPLVRVPLISWVEAGDFADISDPYEIGDAEDWLDVPYNKQTLIALRIRGTSINRIAPDGAVIIIDYSDKELVSGGLYVFKTSDEQATVKRYRTDPIRLEPDSTEPHEILFPTTDLEVVGRVVKVQLDV